MKTNPFKFSQLNASLIRVEMMAAYKFSIIENKALAGMKGALTTLTASKLFRFLKNPMTSQPKKPCNREFI
jgi:hypothetical protein